MRKINNVEINAKSFAWDGCHKLYILNDQKAEKEAKELGYNIYAIDSLLSAFVYSCPLRYIHEWGGNFKTIVEQAADKVVFEGFNSDDLEMAEYEITRVGDKVILEAIRG